LTSLHKIISLKIDRYKVIVAIFAISITSFAQQTYFQQEVNYKMDVKLNDVEHSIKALEEIQYINNASNAISYIYFHLWPNAYKDHQTAMAKQLLKNKKTEFYFSKEEDRGYIDSLDFKVDGKPVKLEYDPENIDICKIILNEPLRSLDTIKITTPFYVKIPDAKFSRLGHDQQAYYITQWYPKPAVYDAEGWHPMPYLDQGEFFSEFGSFDVSITLPKNYVLAATGDREDNEPEENFLNENVVRTLTHMEKGDFNPADMAFPPSSNEWKTIKFKQYRVHDFAWFADKRFNVLHDQIQLPNTNRVVDTWVYFTNKQAFSWVNALDYVNESTVFYSYLVGDYPYNNVSAVDGVIMAGGGMEYPNITVIGSVSSRLELDVTIAHEVGHNWFYGILGSNERDDPFLDEGVNSFYEMNYVRAKYPERKVGEAVIGIDSSWKILGLNKMAYWREKEAAYLFAAKANIDQPIETHSKDFSYFNYGAIVYAKTAVAMDYLKDYMGDESFKKAMQFYFENYKFKHPQPKDLLGTLQYFSGNDLAWFDQYLLNSRAKIDYKIKSVKRNKKDNSYIIKVKNKTGTAVPFNIYGYKDGKPVGFAWFDGADSIRRCDFPPSDVDYFKIDGLDLMPDVNRKNNYIRTRGIFKKAKPLQFNFLTKIPDPTKSQINYVPIVGFNAYNGFMAGLCVHNYSIYDKHLDISIAPMYAFASKTTAGFAEMNLNFYPKRAFTKISAGIFAKSFAEENFKVFTAEGENKDFPLSYIKLKPNLFFEFKNRDKTTHVRHTLSAGYNMIFKEQLSYTYSNIAATTLKFKTRLATTITSITYNFSNARAINPMNMNANVQTDGSMAKLGLTYTQNLTVSANRSFEFRVFAGTFLMGNAEQKAPYRFRLAGMTGVQDYLYDANFFGRTEYNGPASKQFIDADGAFKVWTPLGQSSSYLITANIKSPKIWRTPLRLFADVGTAEKISLNGQQILWDAGVSASIMDDVMEIFFPLAYSSDIKDNLTLNGIGFFNTIRFTFNLHHLRPKEYIKNSFL
jgi:hypothetical protein